MIYISNSDDEINVVCDFERLGINPNELTQDRLESLLEFVRTNSQLWENSTHSHTRTIERRKEAIDALNSILVGEEEEKMDYECSICLEKYKRGDLVKELECYHLFHESCILRWAETSGNCPFCRCFFEYEEQNDNEIDPDMVNRFDLLEEFVTGNDQTNDALTEFSENENNQFDDNTNSDTNEN